MELRERRRERGPLLAAILALFLLGAGGVFLTWQNLRRMHDNVTEHLRISAQAILRSVEVQLLRGLRRMQTPGPDILHPDPFSPRAADLFRDLVAEGDVLFIGLYGPGGRLIISSGEHKGELGFSLPPEAFAAMAETGRWQAVMDFGQTQALVFGVRGRTPFSRFCPVPPPTDGEPGPPPPGFGPGMGRGMGRGMGQGMMRPGPPDGAAEPAPTFLIVGLNAAEHMAQFHAYRRAAMLQTGYVLAAALALWLLAFAYLRRRDQGQRLVRLERFQAGLLDHMPDGLVTLGPSGDVLSANPSAQRLLDPEGGPGLVGRAWSDLGLPPLDPPADTPLWRQFEHRGLHLEMAAIPLDHDPDQPQNLVLIRDRTRVRNLEDDLHEARRLAAIGSLAAGVAHEVRNPLSSLRGFAQLFADKLKGQEPLATYAVTMVQEADRLGRVVTDLLFLARPRDPEPRPVDLSAEAEDLARLLSFDLAHKNARLETDLAAPTVFADPDGLRQALLNLLANSLQAMPEPGPVRLVSRPAPGGVSVEVHDQGPGMSEEVRARALEPFFTAKDSGTGLGLAIVHTIVRAHKGRVAIDSQPGQGAVVRLFFPDRT